MTRRVAVSREKDGKEVLLPAGQAVVELMSASH